MALRFSFLVSIALFAAFMAPTAVGATLRVGYHETFTRFVITSPQIVTHDINNNTLRLNLTDPILGEIPVKPPSVISLTPKKQGDKTTLIIVFTHPIQAVTPKTMDNRKIFDVTLNRAAAPITPPPAEPEKKAEDPLPQPKKQPDPTSKSEQILEPSDAASVSFVAGDIRMAFPSPQASGLAVFQRAGWAWIVLSRPLDLSALQKEKNLTSLNIQSTPTGQIIRFVSPENRTPTPWYEKGVWHVHWVANPPESKQMLQEWSDADGLHWKIPGAAPAVTLTDPWLGDFLWIFTTSDPTVSVAQGRQFATLSLERTALGVVVSSFQKDLPLRQTADVLTLPPMGQRSPLSQNPEDNQKIITPDPTTATLTNTLTDLPKEKPSLDTPSGNNRLFDIRAWRRVSKDQFFSEKQTLQSRLATVRQEDKPLARLTLARFLFAHGFYTESLALLNTMLADDLTLHASAPVKSLRGAALFMNRRYQDARQSFFESNTVDQPEGGLWMAAAFAADRLFNEAAPYLKTITEIPETYSPAITVALLEPLVEAWLNKGDQESVYLYLNRADTLDYTPSQRGRLDLLKARLLSVSKKEKEAQALWKTLSRHPDHFVRTHADYALLDSQHRAGTLKDDEAIVGLERLRFAWRGDAFERMVLNRLVDLYTQKGDYRDALQTLRYLERQYPDTEDGKKARIQMQTLFTDLYLKDKADSMPPLTALALLDEFRFLTPDDETGDEMIRKLADRLVSVDLLDRAGDLLNHQVRERLEGEDKSRVGMRMAMIRLLNNQPEKAIEALNISDYLYVPVALFEKRERLRAEAQVMQNQHEDALETLNDDASEEANQIRAHVYWKEKKYDQLVPLLESMIHIKPNTKTATAEEARSILNYVTALVLANDTEKLTKAFSRYAPLLNGTPWDEAFQALSNPNLIGDPKNVMGAFKDITTLETMIEDYRKQLKTGKLSDVREDPEPTTKQNTIKDQKTPQTEPALTSPSP
ncbi:MAG: tetratricopeptide repeat protein [bacterium]